MLDTYDVMAMERARGERLRQIEVEGFTPEHDLIYHGNELGEAAAVYLTALPDLGVMESKAFRDIWPWDKKWLKLKDREANLRRGVALALAAYARFLRDDSQSVDPVVEGECPDCGEELEQLESGESQLVSFARRELELLSSDSSEGDPDTVQEMINADILNIVQVFSEQGHSGSTAPYSIGIVTRLLSYMPLTPLTGEDSEWNVISHEMHGGGYELLQNKRRGSVFRETLPDGRSVTYDADGFYFTREGEPASFSNRNSRRLVEFPYMPKPPEYVTIPGDLEKNEVTEEMWLNSHYPFISAQTEGS